MINSNIQVLRVCEDLSVISFFASLANSQDGGTVFSEGQLFIKQIVNAACLAGPYD